MGAALTSDARYVVNLIQAGMNGINSARKTTDVSPVSISPVWVPTALGAVLGVWAASRSGARRSWYGVAMSGLVGSAVGLGCGMAWASRAFTGALARGAIRRINT